MKKLDNFTNMSITMETTRRFTELLSIAKPLFDQCEKQNNKFHEETDDYETFFDVIIGEAHIIYFGQYEDVRQGCDKYGIKARITKEKFETAKCISSNVVIINVRTNAKEEYIDRVERIVDEMVEMDEDKQVRKSYFYVKNDALDSRLNIYPHFVGFNQIESIFLAGLVCAVTEFVAFKAIEIQQCFIIAPLTRTKAYQFQNTEINTLLSKDTVIAETRIPITQGDTLSWNDILTASRVLWHRKEIMMIRLNEDRNSKNICVAVYEKKKKDLYIFSTTKRQSIGFEFSNSLFTELLRIFRWNPGERHCECPNVCRCSYSSIQFSTASALILRGIFGQDISCFRHACKIEIDSYTCLMLSDEKIDSRELENICKSGIEIEAVPKNDIPMPVDTSHEIETIVVIKSCTVDIEKLKEISEDKDNTKLDRDTAGKYVQLCTDCKEVNSDCSTRCDAEKLIRKHQREK